jgi:hypothetical protein
MKTPRRHILRELTTSSFIRPADLPGYGRAPDRYQAAVNDLLRERLIEGRTDGDGRMSIALNAHRLADVRKALQPAWTRPSIWVAAAVAAAVVVGLAI